jgi:NAD(P)-dependent dehydrogenase (short-subunit alcohol dehydrogenase family)
MAGVLSGQVAVVTGGGRGIGRAIALSLARAGAAIAVTARSQDQLDETALLIDREGARALAIVADVTDRFSVELMVAEAERRLGPVDLLVNNAGIAGPAGPLWEVDPNDWRRCLEVNVDGTFLCTRAVLTSMVSRGHGRIINLSSDLGNRPFPHLSAYGIANAGLTLFTETLAEETRAHGISVFAISPGLVSTDLWTGLAQEADGQKWMSEFLRGAEAHAQSPEQAADLCVDLASGMADGLSGRLINVKDDLKELIRDAEQIRGTDRLVLRMKA